MLAKRISRGFANPSPAKLLRKTESAFVFALPSFSFWKSSVLHTEVRSATDARLVRIRIVLEKSSDFVQQTQHKFKIRIFAKIRSVAKRRDGGFRQNPPWVFEIQKERAGREAGVMMSTSFKTSFCEPIWKRIIINI